MNQEIVPQFYFITTLSLMYTTEHLNNTLFYQLKPQKWIWLFLYHDGTLWYPLKVNSKFASWVFFLSFLENTSTNLNQLWKCSFPQQWHFMKAAFRAAHFLFNSACNCLPLYQWKNVQMNNKWVFNRNNIMKNFLNYAQTSIEAWLAYRIYKTLARSTLSWEIICTGQCSAS